MTVDHAPRFGAAERRDGRLAVAGQLHADRTHAPLEDTDPDDAGSGDGDDNDRENCDGADVTGAEDDCEGCSSAGLDPGRTGADARIRTADLLITNQLLYH